MSDFLIDEELLAAIDMGSNSFHLAIARVDHGEVKKVVSMSEKVQLAAGLDENKNLTEAAQQRGLACLARFVGRLSSVQPNRLRIVATNALRQAKNGHEFIQQAAEILPKPIEIIAGREEARLIYLGVSHTMANGGRRLVIDIGGDQPSLLLAKNLNLYVLNLYKWVVWLSPKNILKMVKLVIKTLIKRLLPPGAFCDCQLF
jgi:exopolyphosphatase/guanosine-5'-triphosphate,3'-diphosphate pyrophosphatase